MSAEGLPIGVQLIAPMGQDRLLLELSLEIEQASVFKQNYNK
jgi:Asp-tRNA(Asn)/Glu-tRNA(Gln) amidotransferase A subunit family amidase